MALVEYGSESDDETVDAPSTSTIASPSAASKPASGLFKSLPPPTGKLGLNLPPPASSSKAAPSSNGGSGLALPPPKKRGPVKIVLDSSTSKSSDAADEDAERARKRARTAMSGGGGLKGLAGLLPAPKSTASPAAPVKTAAPSVHDDDSERAALKAILGDAPAVAPTPAPAASTSFVPHTTTKANAKAPASSTPVTDFFSLGASSVASSSSHTLDAAPSVSISAAPTIAEPEPEPPKPNYYSTLEEASLSNPYPGFHALPSGDWTPDDPEAWAEWVTINGWDKPAPGDDEGLTDVTGYDPNAPKKPVADKPGRIAADDKREAPQIRKSQNSLAKGRHQLSHMLFQAYDNRVELEERIAAAKANRRSAATKYGF